MGMTPQQFFDAFVDGNTEDCTNNPGCVRRAFNAAVSASHLADHVFEYCSRHDKNWSSKFKKFGDYAKFLSEETRGAFKDIRSISNAYKHLYTDSNSGVSAHSNVSSSGAIELIDFEEGGEIKCIEESYRRESSSSVKGTVVFTRKDGSYSDFLPVLTALTEYWRSITPLPA